MSKTSKISLRGGGVIVTNDNCHNCSQITNIKCGKKIASVLGERASRPFAASGMARCPQRAAIGRVALVAAVFCALAFAPAFADKTVSGAYTLTANEDWTQEAVTLESGASVDLNGYSLHIGAVTVSGDTPMFTGSSGELRVTAATDFSSGGYSVSGSVSFVKDGSGTFTWSGGTIAATVPVSVTAGVFKVGVTTADVFGTSGDIYVVSPGQFDVNFGTANGTAPTLRRTFHIEGSGPDGSGALVNNASGNGYGSHLSNVILTGDATIGGASRLDLRTNGNAISGAGYTLTIKNTIALVVAGNYTTHYVPSLTCERLVIDGGILQPCSGRFRKNSNSSYQYFYPSLTVSDKIVIKNGGKFANYAGTSGTQPCASAFLVAEGTGWIRNDTSYWYDLTGPITIASGGTLICDTAGPWYRGAVTNETGATLNIGGEFCMRGGSFLNDGTINHTAGKFALGHRDGSGDPCTMENNGVIRTSGGTFQFNADGAMSGTGTLDLAGGTSNVRCGLFGFTGTIRVSGAAATIDNISSFPGTFVLNNGSVSTSLSGVTCDVVFDLADKTAPFSIPDSWLTLPADKAVLLDLRGRKLAWGEQIVSWTDRPALAFSATSAPLVEKSDGLYIGDGDAVAATATWTGAAGNGEFFDSRNWTCADELGNPITCFPNSATAITLDADVPLDGWTAFDAAAQTGTIDLNGHRAVMRPAAESAPAFTVTDHSEGVPGELRITVPAATTFSKAAEFAISGNLSLVKDGPGTLSWDDGTLDAAIPIVVTGGVFKVGVTTANVFGSSGTITVSGTGQFDINYGTAGGSAPTLNRTFYIEGAGPDGSGALVNNFSGGAYGSHVTQINLTGDATIGGASRIDFRGNSGGIDGAGHVLTLKNNALCLVAGGSYSSHYAPHLTCARLVIDGGTFQPCANRYRKNTSSSWIYIQPTLTISDKIVIKNGGKFANWPDNYSTPTYTAAFVVAEGDGWIRNDTAYWYTINGPITVESGSVLICDSDGPWYNGAITNKADATFNISGEFNALGGIFKNDGVLNHTGGKLVFGHRDNANYPCAVENDGSIRTTGGTFIFKGESSMTGAGMLEVTGGSPSLAGDFTCFTGTILLNGGTTTFAQPDTFFGTLVLKGGAIAAASSLASFPGTARIDLAGQELPLDVDDRNWFTFAAGREVFVDVGARELLPGDRLLSWTAQPANRVRFTLTNGQNGVLRADANGVIYTKQQGTLIIIR